MTIHISVQSVLSRYASVLQEVLQETVATLSAPRSFPPAIQADLEAFYGQIAYHLGWVDAHFQPAPQSMGKLLRPTLLLLAYEAAGAAGLAKARVKSAHIRRVLPAAVAIELFHNFTLMHDDIEDGDVERRHRPAAWTLWGIPLTINTGDGLCSLSRLALFRLLEEGVAASLVVRLGELFDRACLQVIEGQHLDLCFEKRPASTVPLYMEMIARKTAALMECAAVMGASLGCDDQRVIEGFRQFGQALGIAFQLRDDLLGIWASHAQAGKTAAGDLYRRKKTLPVLYAFQQAAQPDQALLRSIYQQEEPVRQEQVDQLLEVLESAGSRVYCRLYLAKQCQQAHKILTHLPLDRIPLVEEACADLEALLTYVEEDVYFS